MKTVRMQVSSPATIVLHRDSRELKINKTKGEPKVVRDKETGRCRTTDSAEETDASIGVLIKLCTTLRFFQDHPEPHSLDRY